MFMRRGCLFGCAGWLLVCVLLGVVGWFVVIPRVSDALEDGVSDGISTVIADEINPLYSRSELQNGAEVEFSFATINEELRASTEGENVDSIVITSSGDEVVIRADLNNQTFEFGFIPTVTDDGRLKLEPSEEGGWWQKTFMNIMGGGFESAINTWLDQNGLILQDVSLAGDSIILHVIGE